MRIPNDNFIVKHSQALYARDMPYHFSDSLTVQFTPRVSLLDFRNSVSSQTDGREIARYAYISREIIRRYRRLSREKERETSSSSVPFPLSVGRIFRTLGRKRNISLGVISRARHAIGGMSFRLRIYQRTPEAYRCLPLTFSPSRRGKT